MKVLGRSRLQMFQTLEEKRKIVGLCEHSTEQSLWRRRAWSLPRLGRLLRAEPGTAVSGPGRGRVEGGAVSVSWSPCLLHLNVDPTRLLGPVEARRLCAHCSCAVCLRMGRVLTVHMCSLLLLCPSATSVPSALHCPRLALHLCHFLLRTWYFLQTH